MRKIRVLFLMLFVFALAHGASTIWTPENIDMVHLKDSTRYVCDPDLLLSPAARDSADFALRKLQREKGVESVVVIVKRLQGGDCYNFAMALGEKYGVGSKKQSTGLIIVISTEDRGYQILTGKGLEGSLPDAICRRIENRVMVPALKQGDWDGAVVGSVVAIDHYLHGDNTLKREKQASDDSSGALTGGILALIVVGIILWMYRKQQPSKCPQCKKARLVETHREPARSINGRRRIRITFQCPKCGYTMLKEVDDPNDNSGTMGRSFIPPFIFFGGRGGGGFNDGNGGGSFGGGDFGGGGSGGRF